MEYPSFAIRYSSLISTSGMSGIGVHRNKTACCMSRIDGLEVSSSWWWWWWWSRSSVLELAALEPWSRFFECAECAPPPRRWLERWLEVAELSRLYRRLGSPMTRQFIIRLLMRRCEVGKRSGRRRSSLGHTAGIRRRCHRR